MKGGGGEIKAVFWRLATKKIRSYWDGNKPWDVDGEKRTARGDYHLVERGCPW